MPSPATWVHRGRVSVVCGRGTVHRVEGVLWDAWVVPPPGSVTEETDGHDASSAGRTGRRADHRAVVAVPRDGRRRLRARHRAPRGADDPPRLAADARPTTGARWRSDRGARAMAPLDRRIRRRAAARPVDRRAGRQRVHDAGAAAHRATGERGDRRRRLPVLVVGELSRRAGDGGQRDPRARRRAGGAAADLGRRHPQLLGPRPAGQARCAARRHEHLGDRGRRTGRLQR